MNIIKIVRWVTQCHKPAFGGCFKSTQLIFGDFGDGYWIYHMTCIPMFRDIAGQKLWILAVNKEYGPPKIYCK